jgi:alpha-beta hydrolase superfamily lysophospholipase
MTLRRLIILALALVAGCAPVIKPGGPPRDPAQLGTDFVMTEDGARLPLRSWLPPGDPTAVVVAVHGFNDYSLAFEGAGTFLARHGIAVYAYDQRGFGAAPGHGYWPGKATLADDLREVTRLIEARWPGKPVELLGESMGGAVVMVAMTRPDAPPVAGVILSAPAVWSRDSMNIFERGALWLFSHTMPWLTVTGQGLHIQASDNLEMLRRLSRDPLVIKETRVDAIHGLADLMDAAKAAAPRLHVPTLVLYGECDEVVPPGPTYRMMASLPDNPGPVVRAVYAEGWHMLLRDLQAKAVLTDIASWIAHPHRPLPSEADRRARTVLKEQAAGAG